MKEEIYLIGVGNYTEVIIELAKDCNYEVLGLYHYNNDRTGEHIMGIPILDSVENLYQQDIKNLNFAVTIGDNKLRNTTASKLRKLKGITPNLIHPKAIISPSAVIGEGCFIHLNAKISTKCILGNDCIMDFNSLVAHHAVLGNACYLASMAILGSYSKLGAHVLMGINSLVLPLKLTIGNSCVIGSKANVTKSFGENNILIGNPARVLKKDK